MSSRTALKEVRHKEITKVSVHYLDEDVLINFLGLDDTVTEIQMNIEDFISFCRSGLENTGQFEFDEEGD